MPTEPRRWQVRIEVCQITARGHMNHTSVVYGATPEGLRPAVKAYLLYEKLARFSNIGDHLTGSMTYFFADGISSTGESSVQPLEKGWWVRREVLVGGRVLEILERPLEMLGGYEQAIDDFIQNAIIPERGPEYQSTAVNGSELRLHLLEKIVREGDEYPVNDLVLRGWHIVALEYQGELTLSGELLSRKAIFVLGHSDVQAATVTLNTDYYKTARGK